MHMRLFPPPPSFAHPQMGGASAAFVTSMHSSVAATQSVEDRVKRNRFYSQRDAD